MEPIYSQINKEARRFDRAMSTSVERKQAPPRPSKPPLLPAHSLPVRPEPPPSQVSRTIEVVADVHRQSLHRHHQYDTPEKDETAATPTNEAASEDDDVVSNRSDPTYGADLNSSGKNSDCSTRVNPPESVYAASHHPAVPERTSSILRREQQLYQVGNSDNCLDHF